MDFPRPEIPPEFIDAVRKASESMKQEEERLPPARPNLFSTPDDFDGNMNSPRVPVDHRYYLNLDLVELPSHLVKANMDLVRLLENIKRRHDPVVATLGMCVLMS